MVTVAGGGGSGYVNNAVGTAAKFNTPTAMAVDPASGNLYVSDSNNRVIRMVDTSAFVTTIAGTGTSGTADGDALSEATFTFVRGLTVLSSGTILVADTNAHQLRTITNGTVATLAGSTSGYVNSFGTAAKFNFPYGPLLDPAGFLYVGDTSNFRIRRVFPATGGVEWFAGTGATGTTDGSTRVATMGSPQALAWTTDGVNSALLVLDTTYNTLRRIIMT